MRLTTLLGNQWSLSPERDCEIHNLRLDSRLVEPGDLFIALPGETSHGRHYIQEAVARGASAVLVEDALEERIAGQFPIPIIAIKELNIDYCSELARLFYGQPAGKMYIAGVTGTNGKTSCSYFICKALQFLQIPCGIIGTLGSGLGDPLPGQGLTTPDMMSLHAVLQRLWQKGAKTIAMEVSSHSIAQQRIAGIEFDVGIFTNLTQDHLDYHGSMAAYAAVKQSFLAAPTTKTLIINADDPYGAQWITKSNKPIFAYGLLPPMIPAAIPFVSATVLERLPWQLKVCISSPWGEGTCLLPVMGDFNVSNVLATLSMLCLYSVPFDKAITALSQLKTVPGRLQRFSVAGKSQVVIDYAHTPDALKQVLHTLRGVYRARLICVFGCGGNRDHSKRPLMAAVAEQYADLVIITTDNPRNEAPEAIIDDICQGFQNRGKVMIEPDRKKAIAYAIALANQDDVILVAGKGQEGYQVIGKQSIPFSDSAIVQDLLQQ